MNFSYNKSVGNKEEKPTETVNNQSRRQAMAKVKAHSYLKNHNHHRYHHTKNYHYFDYHYHILTSIFDDIYDHEALVLSELGQTEVDLEIQALRIGPAARSWRPPSAGITREHPPS